MDGDVSGPTYTVSELNTSSSNQTMWVRVRADACTTYDLEWQVLECGIDDPLEPNDVPSQLVTVSAGQDLIVNDTSEDYFYLGTLAPGEGVTAQLSFLHALGDIDARLVDGSGVRLSGSVGGSSVQDEETLRWVNSTPIDQPVLLRVFLFGFQECAMNTYDFDVVFTTTTP